MTKNPRKGAPLKGIVDASRARQEEVRRKKRTKKNLRNGRWLDARRGLLDALRGFGARIVRQGQEGGSVFRLASRLAPLGLAFLGSLAALWSRTLPLLRRAFATASQGSAPLRRFANEGWSVLDRRLVRPALRFVARGWEVLHRFVKKRYGKTKFYRRLVRWHGVFFTWSRPARLAVYLGAGFLLWMLSGSLLGFSGGEIRSFVEAGPLSVRVYESVERDYLPTLQLSGQTQASRQVVIRAETSGRIERTFWEIGQYLEAGDSIVAFDPATRPLELEEARTTLQQMEIEYNAIGSLARGGYRSELRRLQALSALNKAQVREDRIHRDLDNTEPKAPFSGVLASLGVERGDFLSIGNEIARLIDLDPLSVRVAVSERDIDAVHLGAKVTGMLINGERFVGKVGTIAPSSNARTRTFEVEIVIANREGRWREGLTAQVHLPIAQRKAHLIPALLLSLNAEGEVGVKTVEKGIVRFQPVEVVGEEEKGLWVKGLGARSQVISVGHENVSEGLKVESVLDERFLQPSLDDEAAS